MSVKHTYRSKDGLITRRLTPARAIREFCKECNGFDEWIIGIKECPSVNCALHPFRFGKDPGITRKLTTEQKEELKIRLKKARIDKNKENENETNSSKKRKLLKRRTANA